jgi:predicted regulator of Ras-like GTPase activity (Roadblock/LC7/MglB family)
MAVNNLSGELYNAHGLHEPVTVSQRLKHSLEEFGAETNASVCALVTAEGLIVSEAMRMGTNIDENLVPAYSASLLHSALKAGDMLKQGDTHTVTLEYERGRVTMMTVNHDMFLVAIAPLNVSAGFVKAKMEKYAKRIKEIMGS